MPNRPASTSAASRFASRRTLGTTLALVALAALAPQPRPAFAQAFSVGLRLDYAVGANPSAMKVGDLNGDGKLDIVVANQNDNTVSVLLGNGAGSFAAQPTLAAGTAPSSLAIADLNGDGRTDLVVTNRGVHPTWGNTVSVLMGNGDGTFQSRTPFETGTWPASVAIGDLNGDGKPDLVVVNNGYNYSDSTVSVLMGNGNGTFQSQTRFVTGRGPYSLSIGDLNSDGKPDLMVANRGVTGSPLTATSLMGNGDGTFQPPTLVQSVFTQIRFEGSMAIGDVNGDGKLDLVWGSSYSYLGNDVYRIRVSFGTGAGGFGGGGEINPPGNDSYPSVLVIADMNGDGYPDVVAERGNAAVYFGNGDGTFSAAWPQIIEIGGGRWRGFGGGRGHER